MGSSAYAKAGEAIMRICRGEADVRMLRLEALDAIRRAVSFDAYAWLLTDPETSVGSSPLADVPCLPQLPQLIRLKYATAVNRWTRLPSGAASLHGTTGGSLSLSLMWRELLSQYQVTDIASSVYRDRFGCWGFLDLWRTGAPAFTAADIEFLGQIASPVVLLLSPALEVRAQTPQTQRYLQVLVPPEAEDQAPVPAGAYNVAAQLLAAEAGVDDNPPVARVHLAGGRWLTLRAARMDADPTTPAASGRDVAVSIEPSTAGDRVTVFARACGLTPREAELLRHLAGGATTREVARQMFVSENTVQDHLKSIFDKSTARSRRTLLARALGT
jgi:DNA-binding CsgD family transcriptional regulator